MLHEPMLEPLVRAGDKYVMVDINKVPNLGVAEFNAAIILRCGSTARVVGQPIAIL